MAEAKMLLPNSIQFSDTIESAVTGADAVVLLTEWNQYRGLDLARVKALMKDNIFVDLRNVYERDLMRKHGFSYTCVGR
jgi:UDPglucose 6-dehydrogenase